MSRTKFMSLLSVQMNIYILLRVLDGLLAVCLLMVPWQPEYESSEWMNCSNKICGCWFHACFYSAFLMSCPTDQKVR